MNATNRFTVAQLLLGIAGVVVALVLTSFHYSAGAEAKLCSTAGGCGTVNTSEYSTVGPIPVSLLGLGAYLVVIVLAILILRRESAATWAPLAIFGVSLIGVLYSLYLTYLELYVIHAICPWCVLSAVIITAIWILSVFDLRSRHRSSPDAAVD